MSKPTGENHWAIVILVVFALFVAMFGVMIANCDPTRIVC